MAANQTTSVRTDPTYWLGREDAETQRLIQQSRFINPFTEHALRAAGIGNGMKVLDAGSGPGDVALIVAKLVGPQGNVVGVDVNRDGLALARARSSAAGYANIEFVDGDCRTARVGDGFDAVIGRLVLTYVSDPPETLRSLVERLKSGGVVVFQEYMPVSVTTYPEMPLWRKANAWTRAAALHAGVDLNVGYKLHQHFTEAGLPAPHMQVDAQLGGGNDWDGYSYLATTLKSMLPLILESGAATAEEVDIETLAERLRSEAVAYGAVVSTPHLVSAWTRKP